MNQSKQNFVKQLVRQSMRPANSHVGPFRDLVSILKNLQNKFPEINGNI